LTNLSAIASVVTRSAAGVVSLFDGQIGECEQQRELVRRDELALVQESLEVDQEVDLPLFRERHHLFQ
jgi:hypothetical protein